MRSLSDVLHPSRRWLSVLALAEFCVLVGAMYAAAHLRFFGIESVLGDELGALPPRALLFAGVMWATQAAMGLYQPHSREGLRGWLLRVLVSFCIGGVVLMATCFLVPAIHVGRGVMLLALLVGFAGVVSLRVMFRGILSGIALNHRVLVLGAGRRAAAVIRRMRRKADRRGFHIIGFVPLPGDHISVPENEIISDGRTLAQLADELDADEIVVGPDDEGGDLPIDDLLDCRLAGVIVVDLVSFFEREAGMLKVPLVSTSWLVFSQGFRHGVLRRHTKRAFDLIVSLVALILAAPLMLLTALAIVIESGWRAPVFYCQERVSLGGKPFMVIKFRSMRTDAEKDGVARWATAEDDRVTKVGRVIRKLRLDELPQIFNVFHGTMSFVGPRPERPQFVSELTAQIPFYAMRHLVKPGITGWAQLRYRYGASVEDAAEKLNFDLYYVKNHSLLFDVLILLQTVEVVLFGKGAR